MIEVRLFAFLRENRGNIRHLEYIEGMQAQHVFRELSIDERNVSILLVNGFHQTPDANLKDEDIVSLYPPVAGG